MFRELEKKVITNVKNAYKSYHLTITFTENVSNNELLDTWIYTEGFLGQFDLIRPRLGKVTYMEGTPVLEHKGFILNDDVKDFQAIIQDKRVFAFIDDVSVSLVDMNPEARENDLRVIAKELEKALSDL